jgi:hypothetical protein
MKGVLPIVLQVEITADKKTFEDLESWIDNEAAYQTLIQALKAAAERTIADSGVLGKKSKLRISVHELFKAVKSFHKRLEIQRKADEIIANYDKRND